MDEEKDGEEGDDELRYIRRARRLLPRKLLSFVLCVILGDYSINFFFFKN